MKRTTIDLWVGIFVAIGLLALVFLSFRVANLTSATRGATYDVTARFGNLGGLKVRAPVKSAGVVVGRVADIQFDNDSFQAVVTLSLDARYRFPLDTSASILTAGLLGDSYIGLVAGSEFDALQNGDEVMITQSALVLENFIGRLLFELASGDEEESETP